MKKFKHKKFIIKLISIVILLLSLNLAYAYNTDITLSATTADWNEQNYNSPVILYGNLLYENADKNNINNFDPVTIAIGTYLGYKTIESLIETGVEYGIAELTEDEEFNPFLSFGKNMAINSTIGLIPGTSEAKLATKAGIYFGKLTLRTAGDTAVDSITRDGDTSDYLITNTVGNIFGDIGGAVIKKYGSKVVGNVGIKAKISARDATIEYTKSGEKFIRVGHKPENLKFTFETSGGAQKGTYAFPEETFNKIGKDPAKLKDLGDLPGAEPNYYRILEPPQGTPIQRGIVPGGEFGGHGGVPEVLFPESF